MIQIEYVNPDQIKCKGTQRAVLMMEMSEGHPVASWPEKQLTH